jgi:hypothetical protein
MDPHPILDKDTGEAAHDPQSQAPGTSPGAQDDVRFPAEDGGKSLAELAERDLTATLQLLAERAQYITGATGAAIALRDHEEMVCRASAGIQDSPVKAFAPGKPCAATTPRPTRASTARVAKL